MEILREHVLIVLNSPVLAGAESMALSDAIEISKMGLQVSFFFVNKYKGSCDSRYTQAGFQVHFGTARGRAYDPFEAFICARRLRVLVRKIQPKIVHAHCLEADIVCRLALKNQTSPTLITTYHGTPLIDSSRWPIPQIKKAQLRYAARNRSSNCFAVSRDLAGKMQDVLKLESGIDIFYNTRDSFHYSPVPECRDSLRLQYDVDAGEVVFICVANFHPYKNHALLLDSVAAIPDQPYSWQLWLVGQGETKNLENQAVRLGIEKKVHFRKDVLDAAPLLQAADVFVLPSKTEGFPLVLIEAMLTGLPVVATTVGGVPELVDHGENGFLVSPESESQMRTALLNVLAMSSSDREIIGENGLRKTREKFSTQARRKRLKDVYAVGNIGSLP